MAEELTALETAGIGAIVSVMDDPSNLELFSRSALPTFGCLLLGAL